MKIAKSRHDGARRSQHVAESDHRESRAGLSFLEGLKHELGIALGRAHDGAGVDGLVGGKQHESLDAELMRQLDKVESADHVDAHGLFRTVLQDGNKIGRAHV